MSGLDEKWRPWCCPEPRCVPLHTLQGEQDPLSVPNPGEAFVCFGKGPMIEYVYDGHAHANDTRSCHYTPNKGLIAYQENADDWRAMGGAYNRASLALAKYETEQPTCNGSWETCPAHGPVVGVSTADKGR